MSQRSGILFEIRIFRYRRRWTREREAHSLLAVAAEGETHALEDGSEMLLPVRIMHDCVYPRFGDHITGLIAFFGLGGTLHFSHAHGKPERK